MLGEKFYRLAVIGTEAGGVIGDPLPDEAGNGLITAEDIAALDLARNRLTVLSACETGLGVIGVGEGVLGLFEVPIQRDLEPPGRGTRSGIS